MRVRAECAPGSIRREALEAIAPFRRGEGATTSDRREILSKLEVSG